MMDVLNTSLTGADIAALQTQVPHAREGQLPQVALLHPRADERHGDVSLDAVDANPGRDQCQDSCHQVDELHRSESASMSRVRN